MSKKKKQLENFKKLFEQEGLFVTQDQIRATIKEVLSELDIQYGGKINLEHPEDRKHGHYATNLPFMLAGITKKAPNEIGEKIAEELNKNDLFESVDFANPGFINFKLSKRVLSEIIQKTNKGKEQYGRTDIGNGKKIQVEYISANPTGPLTFPNARGGFSGDTLCNLLEMQGFEVIREYYVNDAGSQVKKLGNSVSYYYKKLKGEEGEFPEDGYKGEYIEEYAKKLFNESKDFSAEEIAERALNLNLEAIKETAKRMGIQFDVWFHEKELHDQNKIDETRKALKEAGKVFEKDDAVWLKSTDHNDDKDRVLIRRNGEPTYIMGDLAYHKNIFAERKVDIAIKVWGADHHGDIARLRAGIQFLGFEESEQLDVMLISLMKLEKDGEELKMSKRKGNFILLDDIFETVPLDVLRYFSLMYDVKTPMTLKLEDALDTSEKNPVYYVQYAHARMSSVLKKGKYNKDDQVDFSALEESDFGIVQKLIEYPELIASAAKNREVHHLAHFAVELAKEFHAYYHDHKVISEDTEKTRARLALVSAVRTVLNNTLNLMGVSAPESM